jgi:DNA-binding NtrC family response regulator
MATLLTWSDRGFDGPLPAHREGPGPRDAGPIRRLLDQPAWARRYHRCLLLSLPAGRHRAEGLRRELLAQIGEVEVLEVEGRDPTDHEALFRGLERHRPRLVADPDTDLLLSAGTPQAQTLWVVLVQAGLLQARMLQVVPAAFVPDPHPEPVREVRLDFAGFPEIRALREELVRLRADRAPRRLIGQSEAIAQLLDRMRRVARSDVPVLILGETGTGKELVARSLHEASPRASGPFVAESCAAFDEGVLQSELFGHEKGAFTGALSRHRGLFEQAHGGTLLLDEVGELPPRVQVSLLRVLQEGRIRRVGAESDTPVDVRILAATHRDLPRLVAEGIFREDLYYRLRGATLQLPPLRTRHGDLEPLVAAFLESAGARHLRLTRRAWSALSAWTWPGNVRELRAEVGRWAIFCDQIVDLEDLSPEIGGRSPLTPAPGPPHRDLDSLDLAEAVAQTEQRCIAAALARSAGQLAPAARLLGIDRNTLKRKLRTGEVPR